MFSTAPFATAPLASGSAASGGGAPAGPSIVDVTPDETTAVVTYTGTATHYRLDGGSPVAIGASPATITGLTANTEYDLELTGDGSTWSDVVAFGTLNEGEGGGGFEDTITATTSLSAAVQIARAATASLQASVQAARTGAASINAYLQAGSSASASLELAAQVGRSGAAELTAFLQAGFQASTGLQAAVQQGRSTTASLAAAVATSADVRAGLEAALAIQRAATSSLAAAVQGRRTGSAALTVYVEGNVAPQPLSASPAGRRLQTTRRPTYRGGTR